MVHLLGLPFLFKNKNVNNHFCIIHIPFFVMTFFGVYFLRQFHSVAQAEMQWRHLGSAHCNLCLTGSIDFCASVTQVAGIIVISHHA